MQISNQHPRILCDQKKLAYIQKEVNKSGKYQFFLSKLRKKCDNMIANFPPPDYHYGEDEADGWQRRIGNNIADFTAMYCFTLEDTYLQAAILWANKSCNYPSWSRGHYKDCDIVAAHQLFGIAMLYDWCYDILEKNFKKLLLDTILKKCRSMYIATQDESTFWRLEWLQNHMWINMTALMAGGIASFEYCDEATTWIETSNDMLSKTMSLLGEDGASHEGYIYWEYGLDWLFRYMEMARDNLGIDHYKNSWFSNTANYGIYLTLPKNSINSQLSVIDCADGDRNSGLYGSEGQEHLLRKLASEYDDGYSQFLADIADEKNIGSDIVLWQNLLYYNENILSKNISALPTQKHFSDMGIVTLRSDFSGDEALVYFRCAPPLGHKAYQINKNDPFCDWGAGHVHSDVNHFSLFANGEFLIRDDGYSFKMTSNHNTLLVDGFGQAGEGWVWYKGQGSYFTGGEPKIIHTDFNENYDYVVCDGRYAYPVESELEQFDRHFLFIKPNILIIADNIKTTHIKSMEIRLIPEEQEFVRQDNSFYQATAKSNVRISNIGSKFELKKRTLYYGRKTIPQNTPEYGEERLIFLAEKRDRDWQTATAISWNTVNSVPPIPIIIQQKDKFMIRCEKKTYVLDILLNEMKIFINERE